MTTATDLDSLPDRFWNKVDRSGDCWNWTACTNGVGYGLFSINHRRFLAHRVAYEALVGPILGDLTVDHLCRNRRCVRTDHMEIVTRAENIRRGNRLRMCARPGHEIGMRSGKRCCLTCIRTNARRRYALRKRGAK